MKKHNFLQGSLILIGSVAAAKILGAIFRIPLTNMLGGTGMGYFSAAYGIFMIVYAVAVSGIPVTAARFTAEYSSASPEKAAEFRKTAITVCGGAGLAFTLLTLLAAYPFSIYVSRSPEAVFSVAAIAPSVFFCCITAVYRGFFEGRHNMTPTAVSQIIEALIKLITGLALCSIVLNMPDKKIYEIHSFMLRLFPFPCINPLTPSELRLPLASAAALLGVTFSTATGTFYVTAYNSIVNKLFTKRKLYCRVSKTLAKNFTAALLPVAAAALVTNLTSLADLATITRSLEKAVEQHPEFFKTFITNGITAESIPAFFYGSFTGMAVTVFNLIPAFTNMFGKSALPAIAENACSGEKLHESIMNVLFTTAFVSFPCGIGISVLSPQILSLLFPSRHAETAICIMPLRILGAGIIFLSLSSVLFLVLQGTGRSSLPLKIMLWGIIVKFAGNILLTPIPHLNISGAAVSTVLCYGLIFFLSLRSTVFHTGCSIKKILLLLSKLLFCGILCGSGAWLSCSLISKHADIPATVLISVFLGAIIYIISTHLIGVLNKSTLKMLIC